MLNSILLNQHKPLKVSGS